LAPPSLGQVQKRKKITVLPQPNWRRGLRAWVKFGTTVTGGTGKKNEKKTVLPTTLLKKFLPDQLKLFPAAVNKKIGHT
jgi:hypothetical protein